MVHKKNRRKKIIIVFALIFLIFTGLYYGARFLWGSNFHAFFVQVVRHPLRVGAFTPCSRFAAQEITKYIDYEPADKPLAILEVGAGSGVLTKRIEKILDRKKIPYIIDVIEIDPEYCTELHKQFDENPNITIHCTDITQWQAPRSYHYIISALPFATLPLSLIESVLTLYKHILLPTGIVSYYEHMWLPNIKQYFLQDKERKEYQRKLAKLNEFKKNYVFDIGSVWANITPLYVYHAQFLTNKDINESD